MDNKNYYITTPIYYPSGNPHMGHAYSSIIADVFARFKRLDGYNVFFLTGTDEHGLKIQKAAEKNNKKPKDFCDNISKIFKNLTKSLNLSNDDFIRTTEERHHKAVQFLWEKLQSKGYIYLSKYKGWYSVSDEAYYNEDEVIEKDGKKISTISGSVVEWVEEESFFFKLSSFQEKLLEFYNNNPKFILPNSRKNEVVSFVQRGLKDLSVSRKSFTWGIKVPNNKKHIIYVWLDALTNYLSALNYPNDKDDLFKNFWPATLHIIGKDILRFHAIYWPAFLLAADIKPPNRVFSHGWILSGDEKMSKSIGNIVTTNKLRENINGQVVRLALLSSHYKQPLDWNEKLIKESQNTLDKWYGQFEKTDTEELQDDVLDPLLEDLNTPEYISKLHSLYDESSKGNKSSKAQFLSACQLIGLLEEDKRSWENFKKSKAKVNENFINEKIKDRNYARKKGDYKLADIKRKECQNTNI